MISDSRLDLLNYQYNHVHGMQFGPSVTRASDLLGWREFTKLPQPSITMYRVYSVWLVQADEA